ncbi:hypothetical protein U1Q18_028685 [Sarracenia purpurea var. burkii]
MGRAPCCDKTQVKRGPWSPEEDNTLKDYIERFGTGGNWIALPHKAGLKRCGKSCRLRWLNYLRPNIKHGGFTEEEDDIILSLYNNIGSRWAVIASHLPGRTDNDVKNHWNTKLKKKLLIPENPSLRIRTSKENSSSTAIPSSPSSSSSSPFLPKVDNYYYNHHQQHGINSGFSNLVSSSRFQPAVIMNLNLPNYQQNLAPHGHHHHHPQEELASNSNPVREIGKNAEGNGGTFITSLAPPPLPPSSSSQEVASSFSTFFESKYGLWPCNGGGHEDDGFLMGLIGSGFSHDLNGSDFQGKLFFPNSSN